MSFFDFREDLARAGDGEEEAPPPLTPSELNAAIRGALRRSFPSRMVVRGEISNYKGPNQSGHVYFSLKDASAVVSCVIYRNDVASIKVKLADGLEVDATGRLDVYAAGGRYNLVVGEVSLVGAGPLEREFRRLKERLEAEGLFAAERKRKIPRYPRTLALLTSRTGAALQDMLKVLGRAPHLRVLVVPIPVQGEGAAPAIARALRAVNDRAAALGGIDLILLGRGGGSFEDLFEFSREEVARAIAASAIPVITGIGHETDVSIADFVADHHAHTPTEAASFAIRWWIRAGETIAAARQSLRRDVTARLGHARQQLQSVRRAPVFARPDELTAPRQRRVDDQADRLWELARSRLQSLTRRLDLLSKRLSRHEPGSALARRRQRLAQLQTRLTHHASTRLRAAVQRLAGLDTRLHRQAPAQRLALSVQRLASVRRRLEVAGAASVAGRLRQVGNLDARLRLLGPEATLARGYSLTLDAASGAVIRDAAEAPPGTTLRTRLASGAVTSVVTP